MSANSTAVMLFNGQLQIPAYALVDNDEMTKNLAGGAGGLRVSIRGSVWRLVRDGDEIAKNEDRAMNFVIVRSSPDTARTFYLEKWVEGEDPKPPTCWSSNGIEPDAEVKAKQSPKCATCPQNVAGSGDNGSRACRYSRRLAVVPENDMSGNVYQITLPAQSLFGKPQPDGSKMPLQAFAKALAQHKIAVNRIVTEFKFDTDSSTPKVTFKIARFLTPEEIEVAQQQGETQAALDAIKFTVFAQDNGGENEGGEQFEQAAPSTILPKGTVVPQAAEPAAEQAAAPAEEKKSRSRKPAGAAPGAATPASTSTATASAPSPATPAAPAKPPKPAAAEPQYEEVKQMTEKAGAYSYQEYIDIGWDDAGLIEEGLMVIERVAVKPAAPAKPPKPAGPAKPAAKAAEPVVVQSQAVQHAPATAGVASMLMTMDDDE